METTAPEAYHIRGFTLDLARQVLLKDGRQFRLRSKSYGVLPAADPLRDAPRFRAVLARLKLPVLE